MEINGDGRVERKDISAGLEASRDAARASQIAASEQRQNLAPRQERAGDDPAHSRHSSAALKRRRPLEIAALPDQLPSTEYIP